MGKINENTRAEVKKIVLDFLAKNAKLNLQNYRKTPMLLRILKATL